MKWWHWLETKSLEIGIAASLLVGLLAAYARERHEGRVPPREWLVNRLLLMPFLALAAAAGIDSLDLPTRPAMFATALLSLLAFDALRAMAARGLRKIAGEIETVAPATVVRDIVPRGHEVEALLDVLPVTPNTTRDGMMLSLIDRAMDKQGPPSGD